MSKKTLSLAKCTRKSLKNYFKLLDDPTQAKDIYHTIVSQIEKPMLKTVMQKAKNNKSMAAKILGINRNTLHKKLRQHKLDKA